MFNGSRWEQVRFPCWLQPAGRGQVLVIAGQPTTWPWRVRSGLFVVARSGRAIFREPEPSNTLDLRGLA